MGIVERQSAFRELTTAEIEFVSGGFDISEDIVVIADLGDGWSGWGDGYDGTGGYAGGGDAVGDDGGGDGFTVGTPVGDVDVSREQIFKATVKALIPADPITKEIAATIITEIRNALISMTSIENKGKAMDWFDENMAALAQWVLNEYFGGSNGATFDNPLDAFKALFGIPNPGALLRDDNR